MTYCLELKVASSSQLPENNTAYIFILIKFCEASSTQHKILPKFLFISTKVSIETHNRIVEATTDRMKKERNVFAISKIRTKIIARNNIL